MDFRKKNHFNNPFCYSFDLKNKMIKILKKMSTNFYHIRFAKEYLYIIYP